MLDLLIKNGLIVDGTGKQAYKGDIGIKGGKIKLGISTSTKSKDIIDAKGKYICPGFIDAHSHADMIYGHEFAAISKLSQGVTTEIVGQCGSSMAPVVLEHEDELKQLLSVGAIDFPDQFSSFVDYSSYNDWLENHPMAINIKRYIGHGSLRIGVMGFDDRKPTNLEIEIMKSKVRDAMEHGALGLSSGLIYAPSCYADANELIELCKIVGEYGGIYATHIRNEADDVIEAVKEALYIGEKANVPVFISHHKVCGKQNYGKSVETLRIIEEAKRKGQKVSLDQYPYTASMTHFYTPIPPQYFANGLNNLITALKNPDTRKEIKLAMESHTPAFDSYYRNCGGWENIQIASLSKTHEFEGMSVAQVAKMLNKDEFDTYFDLLLENNCLGTGIYHCMSEDDLCRIFQHTDVCVGSDSICRGIDEKGHPRNWGTFPKAICYFNKEKNLMSFESVVHKMTLLPAERTMINNKGAIKEGWDADLVILDYDNLKDNASFIKSNQLASGIEYVIVNGEIVYHDMKLTGKTPGQIIYHMDRY